MLLVIAMLHLFILVWLAMRTVEREVPLRQPVAIALAQSGGVARPVPPQATVDPPKAQLKSKLAAVALPPVATTEAGVAAVASIVAGAPGAGQSCQIGSAMQAAIQNDSLAMSELVALIAPMRTEANAVLLWDGQWQDKPVTPVTGTSSEVTSTPLRDTILNVLAATDPACSGAPVTGPLFLAITEPSRTTTLVIGSGVWHWADLTATTLCDPTQAACVTTPSPRVTN